MEKIIKEREAGTAAAAAAAAKFPAKQVPLVDRDEREKHRIP